MNQEEEIDKNIKYILHLEKIYINKIKYKHSFLECDYIGCLNVNKYNLNYCKYHICDEDYCFFRIITNNKTKCYKHIYKNIDGSELLDILKADYTYIFGLYLDVHKYIL